jgi:hypothetical protein
VLHTFPALLASEALPPLIGYRAPHPSTRGTLTLLSNTLLSALAAQRTIGFINAVALVDWL